MLVDPTSSRQHLIFINGTNVIITEVEYKPLWKQVQLCGNGHTQTVIFTNTCIHCQLSFTNLVNGANLAWWETLVLVHE